ncbi:MAG: hypothetical protein HRT69_01880 [Flavobacteriaceae bacterium]|nr:hypothetical protein [Flavobacteriaceae bacterium]
MKKIVLAAVISISVLSCKKEAITDYKHADEPVSITCEGVDEKLFSEAYYAFENAILTQAKNSNRRPNFTITIDNALKNFIARSRGNIRITDYVTEESLAVFNLLKTQDIWNGSQLKSKAEITECIGNSISNKIIKGTFNTLRSVESLTPKLMVSAITDNRAIRGQYRDKALMTYVALDMYYAKFFDTDFSAATFLTEQAQPTGQPTATPIIKTAPKTPQIGKALDLDVKKKKTAAHGPHDGHNH